MSLRHKDHSSHNVKANAKSDARKTPFGWAPYQEPSTHTATHSPAGQEEKIWRTKARKLLGPDTDNLIGERKRKLRERRKKKKKQKKSLTTSYVQANAQPVTGNYTPPLFFFLHPSFYCWAWHCTPRSITPLASLGQPSWPLPLPACSPARGRVGKALLLHRHCSAKAGTGGLSALF